MVNEPDEFYLVEQELENTDNLLQVKKLMEKPFDPSLINIDTKTPSLDTLIKRIAHDEILLNTETYFQRRPNLWDATKQSRLIESILIRFPLPAFYFDGSDNQRWLVVDGLQRLSSIQNFVLKKENPLKLINLEFLTQLEGKTFSELSRDLQRVIEETTVVIYVINPGTPVDVKFNIFKRINTGGLVLTAQEIRHALFQGAPATFIAELAELPEFIEATDNALSNNYRMIDRDFANRFLAFYLFGYENYQPDLDTFMSKAMAAIYRMNEEEKEKIKADYKAALQLSKVVFGKNAFRKFYPESTIRNPINKAIFDSIVPQFARLTPDERIIIEKNKEEMLEYFTLMLNNVDFNRAISSATGDTSRVRQRHEEIKHILQSILNN
ncbi:hypothetical protein B6N25_07155 [Sphingobacteriales bacterium TSM_CSS]|nr:hypothetical protein B6N25_07155 [Sphingobacteriales bacterium TSM_CSS]